MKGGAPATMGGLGVYSFDPQIKSSYLDIALSFDSGGTPKTAVAVRVYDPQMQPTVFD
jgi:hypothetical protein